ncbi:MAG: hypothetical protein ACLFR6_02555 [Salinarchaeum sp.]
MATAGRATGATPAPTEAATALREATFVRILTRRDGDAIAAAGVLARMLSAAGTPFQVAPTASRAQRARRVNEGDPDATTVAIGPVDRADVTIAGPTATRAAVEIVRAAGGDPPSALALAGLTASGVSLDDDSIQETAEGLTRRPGVGLPVAELTTGLAFTLWLHAEFSGDPEAVAAHLEPLNVTDDPTRLDSDAHRRVASLVAVLGTNTPTPQRAAETIDTLVYPTVHAGPFPTVEGYAEVLDAVAREHPGTAVAIALGGDAIDSARTSWRQHAEAVHAAIEAAETERYGGLYAAFVADHRALTVARVLHRSVSPEPVTLVLGEQRAALVGDPEADLRAATTAIAETVSGSSDGTQHYGVIDHDGTVADRTLVATAREEL